MQRGQGAGTASTLLFADDALLLDDEERELQRMVNDFCTVCVRQNIKVNLSTSEVLGFDRGNNKD